MITDDENVLKGQYILAQGKRRRSAVLGWETMTKIVRVIMSIKEKFSFRTKGMTSIFRKMMLFNSVRNIILHFSSYSRGRFRMRFLYPGRCPGLCYFALSGRRTFQAL